MSLSPVGDTLALTRLIWDLYSKGYAVARDAPKEFQDLLEDLRLLRLVLWFIRDQVTSDERSCSEATHQTLRRCFDVLSDFQALVAKYEKLGRLTPFEAIE